MTLHRSHDTRLPRVFENSREWRDVACCVCRDNMECGSFFKFAQNCLLSVEVSPNSMINELKWVLESTVSE